MKKLRLLVLATNYPSPKENTSLAYIRTRNVYYASKGIHVEVINFSTKEDYIIDDINVHSLKWYNNEKANNFDILICHAPNLKNHYLFLKRYAHHFSKVIFFFHGHEVLKINKVYSKPYSFIKQNMLRTTFQNLYDDFKLLIWRKYFNKNYKSSYCIFVSNWMKNEFYKWTKLKPTVLVNHEYITYNSVGEVFEKKVYNKRIEKQYDFITIRSVLDGSKYCVDIVNNLALKNPSQKFLLIGKGNFFDHYIKAPNLTWIDKRLSHEEMCAHMDLAKCALMPTRTDAQGVMMCEMSAYGMPLITSNIPVCHEVFDGVSGIGYIDNENPYDPPLMQIYDKIKEDATKSSRYYYNIICTQELNIIKDISKK